MSSKVFTPWFLLLPYFCYLSPGTWPFTHLPVCLLMIMQAHTSLATLAAPPTPSGGTGVLEAGQVHRTMPSTEEQVAAQFANGGAASVYRGQWLCCEAAFESKEGIMFLEGALGKAVDRGVLQGWKRKGKRLKALNSNDGLLAGGVAIFKAPKTECFADKAAYVAFGTKPAACVKIQMQKRVFAASSSSSSFSSSSSSFSAAATAAAAPSPAVVGHLVVGGGEFENSNSKRRRASSGVDAAIAADQETEGKSEERIRGWFVLLVLLLLILPVRGCFSCSCSS